MCNCLDQCCAWLGKKFSGRPLSEQEKRLKRRHCKKLFAKLALILCFLKTIESILWMCMFSACLIFYRKTVFFNTIAFGDCNGPKLFFYLVLMYLLVQTILGFFALIGFSKKSWRLIVSFTAIRGCFIIFNLLTFLFDSEGLTFYEVSYNLFTILTLVLTWLSLMIAYLHIYGDTIPIERMVTYDET